MSSADKLQTFWQEPPKRGPRLTLLQVILRDLAKSPAGTWLCVAGFPSGNARRQAVVRLRREIADHGAGRVFEFEGYQNKLYVRIVPEEVPAEGPGDGH